MAPHIIMTFAVFLLNLSWFFFFYLNETSGAFLSVFKYKNLLQGNKESKGAYHAK